MRIHIGSVYLTSDVLEYPFCDFSEGILMFFLFMGFGFNIFWLVVYSM